MGFFSRSEDKFDASHLKASLRMGMARIKIQQNKIVNSVKVQRRAIAELMVLGKLDSARVKVESLIRDDVSLGGLEALLLFCDLIASRSQTLASGPPDSPPAELKEAIASIIWVSSRLGTIAELVTARAQFKRRYGGLFVQRCLENEEYAVCDTIIEKLGLGVPTHDVCVDYLKGIAQEFDVLFDPSAVSTANAGGDEEAGFPTLQLTDATDDLERRLILLMRQ
jgi:hypothetical protein